MTKKDLKAITGLIVLISTDIYLIFGGLSECHDIAKAYSGIQSGAKYVAIQNAYLAPTGCLVFTGIILFLVLLKSAPESCKKRLLKILDTFWIYCIGLFIASCLFGVGVSLYLNNMAENNGYSYCRKASYASHSQMFESGVYVRGGPSTCTEVATELYPEGNPDQPIDWDKPNWEPKESEIISDGIGALRRKDYSTAMRMLRPYAEKGNKDAKFYLIKDGIAALHHKDYSTALQIFRPYAEKGDINAQFSLGVMYYYGQGVQQNDTKAVNWWRKAANQGLARAQYVVGLAYEHGLGVSRDQSQADKWFNKAAAQGFKGLPAKEK